MQTELKKWSYKDQTCLVISYNSYLCGYVGITPSHSLYGKYYSDPLPENLKPYWDHISQTTTAGKRGVIDIFILACDPDNINLGALFDVHGSLTFSAKATDEDLWLFGYDCNHVGDNPAVQNLDYCIKECESLADQLIAVENYLKGETNYAN